MQNIIQTRSGRILNLLHPSPSSFHLEDVSHGLAYMPRFSGQTYHPMSVAWHAVEVWRLSRLAGMSLPFQLMALHHDSPEAYICDLISPVKDLVAHYKRIESGILHECILPAIGADLKDWMEWQNEIHALDMEQLQYERKIRFSTVLADTHLMFGVAAKIMFEDVHNMLIKALFDESKLSGNVVRN